MRTLDIAFIIVIFGLVVYILATANKTEPIKPGIFWSPGLVNGGYEIVIKLEDGGSVKWIQKTKQLK